jgi:hypothetical protein
MWVFLGSLLVSAALIIAIFAAIGFVTGDSHWLQRGGALVAAYGAGIGVVTFVLELYFEDEEHKLDAASQRTTKSSSPSPLGRVATRLNAQMIKRQRRDLRKERLYVAATVAMCLLIGEICHGFGDLVLELLFVEHFDH